MKTFSRMEINQAATASLNTSSVTIPAVRAVWTTTKADSVPFFPAPHGIYIASYDSRRGMVRASDESRGDHTPMKIPELTTAMTSGAAAQCGTLCFFDWDWFFSSRGIFPVAEVRECLLRFGDIQSRFGSLQCVFRPREINLRIVALEPLFSPPFGFFCACNVNFLRMLGRLRQNRDFVG
jgi:hypothetical protein